MHDHTNQATKSPATQSQTQDAAAKTQACNAGQPGHCNAPSHGDIARRAYDIYLKSGRKQGQCTQNWNQAEQSLRNQQHTAGR